MNAYGCLEAADWTTIIWVLFLIGRKCFVSHALDKSLLPWSLLVAVCELNIMFRMSGSINIVIRRGSIRLSLVGIVKPRVVSLISKKM